MNAHQGDLLHDAEPAQEFGNKPGVPDLKHELLMVERIRAYIPRFDVFDGDTEVLERSQRIRRVILERELETVICAPTDARPRKCLTFSQAFEWLYGEPLVPKPRKGKS
jgi:hypothetical protein